MKTFVLAPMRDSFKLVVPAKVVVTPPAIITHLPRVLTLKNPTAGLPLVVGVALNSWSSKEEAEAWREKAWREVEQKRLGSWRFAPPPWEDPFVQMVRDAVEVADAAFDSSLTGWKPTVAEPIPEKLALTTHAIRLSPEAMQVLQESVDSAEKQVLDAWGEVLPEENK